MASKDKYKKFETNISAEKYAAKFKEIEAQKRAEEEEYDMEEGEDEYEFEEVESDSQVESELSLSEGEPALHTGTIDITFPETIEEFHDSAQCYPRSYYTVSTKERLLLLYAENFRRQFVLTHPRRRAMVLALPNECNVQVKLLLLRY